MCHGFRMFHETRDMSWYVIFWTSEAHTVSKWNKIMTWSYLWGFWSNLRIPGSMLRECLARPIFDFFALHYKIDISYFFKIWSVYILKTSRSDICSYLWYIWFCLKTSDPEFEQSRKHPICNNILRSFLINEFSVFALRAQNLKRHLDRDLSRLSKQQRRAT